MAFASPVERELAQLLMFKDSDKKQATAKTMIANIRKQKQIAIKKMNIGTCKHSKHKEPSNIQRHPGIITDPGPVRRRSS